MTDSLLSILKTLGDDGDRGGQAVVMWSDRVGVGTLVLAKFVNKGAKTFLVNFVSVGDMLKSSPQMSEKSMILVRVCINAKTSLNNRYKKIQSEIFLRHTS